MKAKNTNIQSAIDYICSHSGFIGLDEEDFEFTCPNPTICIDKKGETLNEVVEAVTTEWKMLSLPKPSSTVLFIESRIITMADLGYINDSFKGFDSFKLGLNCEEPDGAKVRVILIG